MRCLVAVLALLLAACQVTPEPQVATSAPPPAACDEPRRAPAQRWLREVGAVAALSPEEAREALRSETLDEGNLDRFRFALLNQRTGESAGWIRARDSLRDLLEHGDLGPQRSYLTQLLLQYSQAMINGAAKQEQMLADLAAARSEQEALSSKIEALTSIEQNISERKNQGDEPGSGN